MFAGWTSPTATSVWLGYKVIHTWFYLNLTLMLRAIYVYSSHVPTFVHSALNKFKMILISKISACYVCIWETFINNQMFLFFPVQFIQYDIRWIHSLHENVFSIIFCRIRIKVYQIEAINFMWLNISLHV